MPIVLATFAPSEGVAQSDPIFNAVFSVVLVSALLQGPTLEPLARRLGLTTEPRPLYQPPIEVGALAGADLVEFLVGPRDAVVGRRVRELGLPLSALVAVIVRDDEGIPPRGRTRIEAGDRLYVLVRARDCRRVEELFVAWREGPLAAAPRAVPPEGPTPASEAPARSAGVGLPPVWTLDGALSVVVGADDEVELHGAASPEPSSRTAALSAQAGRRLALLLLGFEPEVVGTPVAWRALPGVGERLTLRISRDESVAVVVNRIDGARELYLLGEHDEPRHIATLQAEEAHRLAALLLAAAQGPAG